MKRFLACVLLATLVRSEDTLVTASQQAKKAMAEKRFTDAAELYRRLIQALPKNAGMRLNLGLALYSAGDFRGAIEPLQVAAALDGTLATAHFLLGIANLKLGQSQAAIPPLRRALELQPDNAVATLELADAYLTTGQFRRAAEYFRKLSVLTPASPKAWYGLGLTYLRLSGHEFAELEKLAPKSGFRLALRARARFEQQHYQEAFHLYRQALERTPNLRGVHVSIAEIYRRTGLEDWATAEAAKDERLPPPDCRTQPLECAFVSGKFEEVLRFPEKRNDAPELYWRSRAYAELAMVAFARLATLPPSGEMHELLADSYRIQGRHADAAEELRKALGYAPADPRLQRALARALWLDRNYQEARPMLERLVAAGNQPAEVYLQLGDILQRIESSEKALPHLETAVRLDPRLLPARAALGRAYVAAGRGADAIPQLQAALPTDDQGALLLQLSRAFRIAGREPEARDALRKYQERVRARQSQLAPQMPITAP